jgi:hypothetical protein
MDIERLLDRIMTPAYLAGLSFFGCGTVMYIGAVYNEPIIMFSSVGFFFGGAATTVIHFLSREAKPWQTQKEVRPENKQSKEVEHGRIPIHKNEIPTAIEI